MNRYMEEQRTDQDRLLSFPNFFYKGLINENRSYLDTTESENNSSFILLDNFKSSPNCYGEK